MTYGLLQNDAQPLPTYGDNIIGDQSQQESNIPKTLKTPTTPSQSEIDEHLPYRDWCKHCVQGKSRQHYHQSGGLTKQSIRQIDCAFLNLDLKNDNNKHNATVLTMCESTSGLGHATIVPYKGINHEALSQSKDSLWKMDYKRLSYSEMVNQRSLNFSQNWGDNYHM
eukprot:3264733-Amphidinium_carterae.9